jgi:hypothetical protein
MGTPGTPDQTPVANWHRHELVLWAMRLAHPDFTIRVNNHGCATVCDSRTATTQTRWWEYDLLSTGGAR